VLLELGGMLGLFGGVLLLAPGLTALLGRAMLLPFRPFSSMATWLVDKVLKRSSGRVSAAVCGLSAVLLALIGLKSLTRSLEADVDQFARAALTNVMFLQCEPTTLTTAQLLAKVAGVRQVDAYEGEVRSTGFLLRGLSVESAGGRGGPLEGSQVALHQYSDQRSRGLIVSRRLAKSRDWQQGSLVALRDKNGTPVSYEVLLVDDRAGFDSDERAFAITSPYWLRHDFCIGDQCVELITLRLQPDANEEIVRAAAKATLPNLRRNKTGESVRQYMRRDVGRDFQLFDLLLFLMMGLAGVGLLNGMTIAALGRARELGVLRALGIKRSALGGSFLVEGAVVAGLASLLSLGLIYPLASVLVLGMNAVAQLDAPVTMPFRWLFLVPVAAFATAILASLLPAWRALRQSPSESVRYE
jgi:putative ABC transport system permease protein